MRPLRLLHLVSNPWWTGSAAPALELAAALRARGHDVRFGCVRGDALEGKAREAGLAPVDGLGLERTARPWALARDVRALRRLVREHRIEVVHAHLTHDHWLAALAVAGSPARLVRTVHLRRAVRRSPLWRWLVGRTAAVIAVSAGIAEALRAAGVAPERVTVVPGAVDVERFRPDRDGAAVRERLGLGAGPVVGCVARLTAGRGHELLLHAVDRLRSRVPTARLVLVGRGEARPALEALVRRLRLDDHVVFAGYRGDDLPETLVAMDCFVLLGSGSEESCRAVLEAMAAGRPVVAGRVGALPETVTEGRTGWLVDGDAGRVAERLATLLLDPGRARAMGEAARRDAVTRFSQARRAAAVEQVYARVL
jgi:glycosyltransferase involved in cell wall biosynthesis